MSPPRLDVLEGRRSLDCGAATSGLAARILDEEQHGRPNETKPAFIWRWAQFAALPKLPIRTLTAYAAEFDRFIGAERYAARDFADWVRVTFQAGQAGGHRVVERRRHLLTYRPLHALLWISG